MTWKQAFRKQAKSDYDVFRLLNNNQNLPVCHSLHYLQMTMEKIAKSFFCDNSNNRPAATHHFAERLVNTLRTNVGFRNYCGFQNSKDSYSSWLQSMYPLTHDIEMLAPGWRHPNVEFLPNECKLPNSEYPWMPKDNEIIAPVDYDFSNITRNITAYCKIQKFIGKLLEFESQ